jgi:peptide deformylase
MKILPIVGYGDPVLKKKSTEITADYPDLDKLIANMFSTMYNAEGIGLAAPQIGLSIRLFIADTKQLEHSDKPEFNGICQAFINPTILSESGEEWKYEEGCLSIPGVRGDVWRQPNIIIRYQDQEFNWKEEVFDGMNARVIQHEYDHIEGILFTDKLMPLKKKLVSGKLKKITKGEVHADYPMRFAFGK